MVWAETGYFLQSAALYTHFSESKKSPTRIKGKRFSPLKRRSESEITFVFGLFLLILGGNGLSTSMCNPILTLFYGEKSSCEDKLSKSRSRDYSPLDNPPTVGFCPNLNFFHLNYLYKRNRLATTVRPCNLRQNRRATGARIWGSVRSKTIFGASVTFYILKQSTGHAFTTSSLSRDDYG